MNLEISKVCDSVKVNENGFWLGLSTLWPTTLPRTERVEGGYGKGQRWGQKEKSGDELIPRGQFFSGHIF